MTIEVLAEAIAQLAGRLDAHERDETDAFARFADVQRALADKLAPMIEQWPEVRNAVTRLDARDNELERRIHRAESHTVHGGPNANENGFRALPPPPRLPRGSTPDLEPDEVTIVGQRKPVVEGEVRLTVSEISALKRTMSLAQKVWVGVLVGTVLSLGAVLGAVLWREGKAIIVPGPPIMIAAGPDAGIG